MFKNLFSNSKDKKRIITVLTLCTSILFCTILSVSFSIFTQSNRTKAANITVGNLEYTITIDGLNNNVIEATNNAITKKNVILTNINNYDTNYELTYKVYSDDACTNEIELPDNVLVEYSSNTIDSVRGAINVSGTKNIRIIVTNNTSTNYYIKFGVNAGFSYNTLAVTNQINSEYQEAAECSAGTYLLANSLECTTCPAGSYCPGGTYYLNETEIQGISACNGRTQYSTEGSSSCSTVTSGYYTTGCDSSNNNCTGQSECTAGNYCVNGVSNACGGSLTSAAGAPAQTSCYISCAAGQHLAANATACSTCPAGKYCAGTRTCYFNASAAQGISGNCNAGTYSTGGATAATCTACPTGSYQNSTGKSVCIVCGNGKTTSGTGKTASSQCTSCSQTNVASWNTTAWSTNKVNNLCSIKTCASGYILSSNACSPTGATTLIAKVGTGGLVSSTGGYRYEGASPNNYATFNGETWRIIGILNTKTSTSGTAEKRIKLIRNASIGNTKFGSNNTWSSSYIKTGFSRAEVGTAYGTTDGNSTSFTFKLNSTAQNLIANAVWYIGKSDNRSITAATAYTNEQKTTWTGKMGLMSISDYGFASSTCKETKYLGDYDDCTSTNWMFSGNFEWTMIPNDNSDNPTSFEDYIGSTGNVVGANNTNRVSASLGVRPVVYLKANVKISGSGTSGSPYTFSI